jgi:uncharacterized protein (TIGR03435 family)
VLLAAQSDQSTSAANAQFEAASIKPADPSLPGSRMSVQPGRVEISGMSVRMLLRNALQRQEYQIVGFPDWVNSERYSIVAKVPEGVEQRAVPAMLVTLLKDRFKLAMHSETREMPIYALVVARADGRLGPNLKPTPPACQAQVDAVRAGAARPGGPGPVARGSGSPPDFSNGAPCGMMTTRPGLSTGSGQPLEGLIPMLTNAAGRPVADKTGLNGLYDFTLRWAFDPTQGAGPLGAQQSGGPVAASDPDAPNLFTALQEQLGLKLESQRAPMDVVVIDRIDHPNVD